MSDLTRYVLITNHALLYKYKYVKLKKSRHKLLVFRVNLNLVRISNSLTDLAAFKVCYDIKIKAMCGKITRKSR